MPVGFLPPSGAFQGSNLPYPVLLAAQLAILFSMAWFAWRVQAAALVARQRLGRVLAWLGGIYLAGSLGRLAIGLFVAGAPEWFTAWISGVFHLVLAGYVLALSAYHLGGRRVEGAGEGA